MLELSKLIYTEVIVLYRDLRFFIKNHYAKFVYSTLSVFVISIMGYLFFKNNTLLSVPAAILMGISGLIITIAFLAIVAIIIKGIVFREVRAYKIISLVVVMALSIFLSYISTIIIYAPKFDLSRNWEVVNDFSLFSDLFTESLGATLLLSPLQLFAYTAKAETRSISSYINVLVGWAVLSIVVNFFSIIGAW